MEKQKKPVSRLTVVLALIALILAAVTVATVLIAAPYFGMDAEDPALLATDPPLPPPTTEPPEETEPTLPPPEPNPYGSLDFQYNRNNYLKLLDGESVTGIDVSRYQYDIDFDAVKASGVGFVIIRLAYRGYESGKIVFDKYAHANLERRRRRDWTSASTSSPRQSPRKKQRRRRTSFSMPSRITTSPCPSSTTGKASAIPTPGRRTWTGTP